MDSKENSDASLSLYKAREKALGDMSILLKKQVHASCAQFL